MARLETTYFRKVAGNTTEAKLRNVIIFLALVLACWPILFGQFYAVGDMRDVYIPLELFFQEQLRAGNLPTWSPDVAWGFPVLAAAQIGVYYPPLLLGRLLLPIHTYIPLVFVGHIIAMGYGMWLFMRRASGVGMYAALFSAAAFTGSAFIWQHTTHLNIFLAVAWLPWQLVTLHHIAKHKHVSLRQGSVAIFTLGIPFLIGQLQIPLLMAAVSSFYFVHVHARHDAVKTHFLRRYARPSSLVAIFAIGVILLTAAQLAPTLELLQFSSRGSEQGFSIERANQYSFPVYHLPTLLFPRFYGNDDTYWGKRLEIEYGAYFGIAPLLFGLWGIWRYRKQEKFFVWLTVVSALLALGSASPFRLLGIEPSLWVFSAPARWLLFTTIGMSYFAGLSFDRFSQEIASMRQLSVTTAVGVGALVVVGNVFLFAPTIGIDSLLVIASKFVSLNNETAYYMEKMEVLLQSARNTSISLSSPYTWVTILLLSTLPFLLKRPKALLTVTALELSLLAATTTPAVPWKQILHPPATLRALPQAVQNGNARMYAIREGGDTGALFTDPASRADSATRMLQHRLLVPMIHAQFGIAGVEWPASLDFQSHAEILSELRAPEGYEITSASKAQELNIGAVLVPDTIDTFKNDPNQIIDGVAVHILKPAPRAHTEQNEEISYTQISPTNVRLSGLLSTQNAKLDVTDTWYPGWEAITDSGAELKIEKNNAFRQIYVPAGTKTIDMTYTPVSVYAALIVSSITALGLLYALKFD